MTIENAVNEGVIHKLLNHQGLKKYFFNTSWLMAENVLRLLSGLFVGIYVARYLGPQQFGVFSYSLAFVSLFSAIAKLGIDYIVVRELVNHPEQRDEILGTAFWLKVSGALIMLVLISLSLPFTNNDAQTNFYILIIAAGAVFQAFEVIDFYFQAKVQARYVSICKTVQLFLLCVLKLYCIFIGAELLWFIIVILFGNITLGVFLVFAFYSKESALFFTKFSLPKAKTFLSDSWPLIFSGLVIMIYMRIDQVMIKEMLSERDVGLYSAAVRISEVWYFIPVLISSSLFPAIISAKKISEEFYIARLQKIYSFHFLLAIVISLPIILFSSQLVNLLYGSSYQQSSSILQIHMFCGFFVCMGVVRGKWMISENLQYYDQFIHIIGAISNVLLNFIFIPIWGVIGAAYGTLAAYIFTLFFSAFVIRQIRPAFFMILRGYWNVLSLQIFRKGYFYA